MRLKKGSILLVLFFAFAAASYAQKNTSGFASSYPQAMEGLKTASGELYCSKDLTACHASLPFNTLLKVTNLQNKKSVVVRVNDRFPFRNSRVVDISNAAASQIDLFGNITPQVTVEVIGMADEKMIADLKAKQTLVVQVQTPPKTDKPAQQKKAEPKTEVAKAPEKKAETATASVPSGKKESPGLLSSISASIPSISLKDVNELAVVTIKYIAISLFK
jgi:rare lipoprotein A